MKKILAILIMCFFTMAIFSSNPVTSNTGIRDKLMDSYEPEITQTTETTEEPPNWANGNFTGVWGIDIWGETQIPLGWIYGYYKRSKNFGYFYAGFNDFWDENDTSYLQGYLLGPYMFGTLGSEESANETAFVGLGGYNETHFYWRVMTLEGPTYFMYGEYFSY